MSQEHKKTMIKFIKDQKPYREVTWKAEWWNSLLWNRIKKKE